MIINQSFHCLHICVRSQEQLRSVDVWQGRKLPLRNVVKNGSLRDAVNNQRPTHYGHQVKACYLAVWGAMIIFKAINLCSVIFLKHGSMSV